VSSFIEENRYEVFWFATEEGIENHHFGHSVIGASSMSAYATSGSGGGEKDNCIPTQLDVGFKARSLCVGEGVNGGIEGDLLICTKIDRESSRSSHGFLLNSVWIGINCTSMLQSS
jgi:hypothetical protein